MKRTDAFPSNFLKSDDIGDKEVMVTISGIEMELMPGDEKEKPVLSFKETEKKLVCNITNWDIIEKVTGKDDTDQWIGEKITLVTMQVQKKGGGMTMGIRVSLKKPAPAFSKPLFTKPATKPAAAKLSPIHELCVKSNITEPVLMEFLTSIDLAEQGMTIDTLPAEAAATVVNQWDEFAAKIKEVVG